MPTDLVHSAAGTPAVTLDVAGALARLGNDKQLYQDFIQIYLADAPRLAQAIETALQDGDSAATGLAAHSLKGLASSLGALGIVAAAQPLETMGRLSDIREGPQAFKKLVFAMEAVVAELNEMETHGA